MFPSKCCLLGDRKTREAPTNSPGVAEEPAKVAEKQGGEPDEKKKEEETQPADKDKEEKSKSTVSKNMDQNTFLVRVVCLLAHMKTIPSCKVEF